MGYYKELLLEQEEEQARNPFGHVSDRLVGKRLLGNALIGKYFDDNASEGICSYTGKKDLVLPLKEIVEHLFDIICSYYVDAKDAGLGWNSNFDKENEDDGYGQNPETDFHMEQGGFILPPGKTIYDDISLLLINEGFKCIDGNLFDDIVNAIGDINLVQNDPYGLTDSEIMTVNWKTVCESTIRQTQIGIPFNDIIKSEQSRLYELISNIQTAQYPLLIYRNLSLYRAVPYMEPLPTPVPFDNVTSAPAQYAAAGRMNRKGDSMFYGTSNQNTALLEACANPDKPYAYIGKFDTLHPVHLLDLRGIQKLISIFEQSDTEYHTLVFLDYFCRNISLPNDGDNTKYAPTQLVTHYLRHALKHYLESGEKFPIDGILFSSSKNGSTNAVLFYDNAESRKHLELKECGVYVNGAFQSFLPIAL